MAECIGSIYCVVCETGHAPVIGTQIQAAVDVFFLFLEAVSEIINSVLDTLNGLLDFLTVYLLETGKRHGTELKHSWHPIWDLMKLLVSNAIQTIWNIVCLCLDCNTKFVDHYLDGNQRFCQYHLGRN